MSGSQKISKEASVFLRNTVRSLLSRAVQLVEPPAESFGTYWYRVLLAEVGGERYDRLMAIEKDVADKWFHISYCVASFRGTLQIGPAPEGSQWVPEPAEEKNMVLMFRDTIETIIDNDLPLENKGAAALLRYVQKTRTLAQYINWLTACLVDVVEDCNTVGQLLRLCPKIISVASRSWHGCRPTRVPVLYRSLEHSVEVVNTELIPFIAQVTVLPEVNWEWYRERWPFIYQWFWQ